MMRKTAERILELGAVQKRANVVELEKFFEKMLQDETLLAKVGFATAEK